MISLPSLTCLQDQDIKVLAGDTSKFAMAGPRLMGTKFFMVSDKLKDPMVKCMSLKATGADKPYYLVFGLIPDGKILKREIAGVNLTSCCLAHHLVPLSFHRYINCKSNFK